MAACQEEPVTCKERPHEAALDGELLQLAWVGGGPQFPDQRRQQLQSLHHSRKTFQSSPAATVKITLAHTASFVLSLHT